MFGRRPNSVVPLPSDRAAPEADARRAQPEQREPPQQGAGAAEGQADAARLEDERRTLTAALAGDAGITEKIDLDAAVQKILPTARKRIELGEVLRISRGNLATMMAGVVDEVCEADAMGLETTERRKVVTIVVNRLLGEAKRHVQGVPADSDEGTDPNKGKIIDQAKARVQPILMDRIDVSKAVMLPPNELAAQIGEVVGEILGDEKIQLNSSEQRDLVTTLLNDLLGLGPLEVLLADDKVTDIMVNGPKQIYVERGGKLLLTDVTFRDDAHVMNIATRIVSRIGRRVDESTPLVDARLQDGSRVNIIIPPLALDGPTISIRKFAKQKITLDKMEGQGNISAPMATVLKIASRCRLNIVISGGTGSGKTTLLNAMSRMIDNGERIVTIEDAAELQLQQPHVVRLETRSPNLEGNGEITQRELVKNALRMRPDRIILGEIRAGEALDMLQAMNTGHDGSMCTLHANRPREALTRLENMVAMTGVKLPHEAVRSQIAGAVNMVVQIARMRDGVRRVTHITEIVGMEGEVITTQDLFTFEFEGEDQTGRLVGRFKGSGLRPHFTPKAEYFGLDRALLDAVSADDGYSR